MSDITIKYGLLDHTSQKEVNAFIEHLLSKQRNKNSASMSDYKRKILNVSVWSDEDLKIFEANQKTFDQWNVQEW